VEFWKKQAYDMAKIITNGSQLSSDLVSHIYILLYQFTIPEDELPKAFWRYAHNQWNWRESDFNKKFKTTEKLLELPDNIFREENDDISEMQNVLLDYLELPPQNDSELFCKEIVKMRMMGMTYRDIKRETKIELRIIFEAIQQFKYDLFNYNYQLDSCGSSKSNADFSPAEF